MRKSDSKKRIIQRSKNPATLDKALDKAQQLEKAERLRQRSVSLRDEANYIRSRYGKNETQE
jgi:hypothetical protein